MIMLLALPVIAAVALVHRYLLLYAPSNVLMRRARASRPTLSTVAVLLAVAAGLIVAVKVLSGAMAAGAPGWLNWSFSYSPGTRSRSAGSRSRCCSAGSASPHGEQLDTEAAE